MAGSAPLTSGSKCVFPQGASVYYGPMNKSSILRPAGAYISAMLFAAVAQADERTSDGPQTGHVHGRAQLNLVVESGFVHIELISPAVNIIGFEHAPVSGPEHAARQKAFSTLEDAERLFRFDKSAGCSAEQTGVAPGSKLTAQPAGQDAHHHHEAGDDESGDAQHTDIVATYRFSCNSPDGPVTLRVGLFDAFPAIDSLVVQYITDSQQGGITLSSGKPVLTF